MRAKTYSPDVMIAIKSVPLIWLVWIGIALLAIGMGVVCGDERFRQMKSGKSPPRGKGSG